MNIEILVSLYFIFGPIRGELDYNIEVPEFICDKNHDAGDIRSGTTTIGLKGEGSLEFKVTFEQMGQSCRNPQRCNLMTWKVIREFEKFLNSYPHTQSNAIEFSNTMLLPGLKYILNVFVTQGEAREHKQVVLNFVDDDSIRAAEKPLASIKLVGVSLSDGQIPYVLHAEVNICSNISDYYFQWELLDDSSNLLQKFVDRSSELLIPPSTFRDSKTYIIKCNLMNMENNEPLAKNTLSVNIMNAEEPLIVKLPMIYTTVQVQQLINIRPYVVDLGNQNEDIKIEWSCMYKDKNVCENYDDEELNIEGGFLDEGEYNISLKVTKASVAKSDSCLVKVMRDVPSIEIETVESPILPSTGVTIKANVNDLRTFCTLQWRLEEETEFFKLSDVPGDVDGLYNVTVTRDLFLKEFEEFSSDVINKEFNLVIPPRSGKWTGLPNSGEHYNLRFLLEVKCPKAQLQSNDIEIEFSQEMLNDTVTVSALVNVDVKVAPELQPLQVEPSTGVALETVFRFQTQQAVKDGTSSPLLYKFGYLLGDKEFIFCNMLGFEKAEAFMPYTDDGVRTFLEVCDSSKSCRKTFGPTIKTSPPDKINERMVLRLFKEKLNTEDFYKAFGYASSVVYTAKTLNEDDKFRQYFSDGVYNKIQYLLNSYSDSEEWAKRVNKLISNISEFNNELSFSDEVLSGLVELRSKLLAAQEAKRSSTRRQLLGQNKKATNLDNFKSYLEVSDLIIAGSTDKNKIITERVNLRQKILEYMGRLCVELFERQQKISLQLKSVIFVVEKLPRKSLNNFQIIPFDGNLWNTTAEIKINAEALDNGADKLCISKTAFKDFFNKTGVSYGASVINGNDGSLILDDVQSTILMPVDKEQLVNKIPKCIVYNDRWLLSCKFMNLLSTYAQCSCTKLGNFYLEYENAPAFTTTTTKELPADHTESTYSSNTEVDKVNTVPAIEKVYSTNSDAVTPKSQQEQPVTLSLIKPTTDIDENNAITTVKEKVAEVTQSDISSISDASNGESQSKGTDSPSVTSDSSLTSKNTAPPPSVTDIVEVTEVSQITDVATSVTSSGSVTEESVPLPPDKETDVSYSATQLPASDSDTSTTIENPNANTESDKVTVSVTSLGPLLSTLDGHTSTSVNAGSNSHANASVIPATPTAEIDSNEGFPKNNNDKNIGSGNNLPTEIIPTFTQFLPSPVPTVLSKNVTNDRNVESGRFRGGSIQGGIQANFNTGFSLNFYLNNTYK